MEEEADIIVRLLSSSSSDEPLSSLPLHSQVLSNRSEFFAALLSERWHSAATHDAHLDCIKYCADVELDAHVNSRKHGDDDIIDALPVDGHKRASCVDIEDAHSNVMDNDFKDAANGFKLRTVDIVVSDVSAASVYERCFELMYMPSKAMSQSRRPFSGVAEALHMLNVAVELLFHDCVDLCMQFLEMVPSWTPSEEESIRSTLARLEVHVCEDLALRHSLPHSVPLGRPMYIMRDMLTHVLHEACKGLTNPPDMGAIHPSKPIPEATILAVWCAHMQVLKKDIRKFLLRENIWSGFASNSDISILQWLFTQLLDLQAADAVVEAFAGDIELSSLTTKSLKEANVICRNIPSLGHVMLWVLQCITEAILEGKVLLPRRSRLTFASTWLPVIQSCNSEASTEYAKLIDGFRKLMMKSFSFIDREVFYRACVMTPNVADVLNITSSFSPWCAMLREAHSEQKEERGRGELHRQAEVLVTQETRGMLEAW